jgi:hypothetical protein
VQIFWVWNAAQSGRPMNIASTVAIHAMGNIHVKSGESCMRMIVAAWRGGCNRNLCGVFDGRAVVLTLVRPKN